MKRIVFRKGWVIFASLLMLSLPAVAFAQANAAVSGQPPIAQQLIREGDLAKKLAAVLDLGTYDNEAQAESVLGDAGIVPRNGWIADYPVTPDIVGELQKSVGDAADARKIEASRVEALQKLSDVIAGMKLAVTPSGIDETAEAPPAEPETYPDQAEIDDYYATEGPPVVTYYAPPPDYYYLYSWVPYPFWYTGFWFSGFFILNDFHRPCFVGNHLFFVSNHFHPFGVNRVFRIDPVGRFQGRTFAGIGVHSRDGFVGTGGWHGNQHALDGSRNNGSQAFHNGNPALHNGNQSFRGGSQAFHNGNQAFRSGGQSFPNGSPAFHSGSRMATWQSRGSGTNATFAHSGMRSAGSPSFGGGTRMASPSFSGGGRMASPSSFGGFRGGGSAMHGSFGGGSFGRGGGGRR